MTAKENMTKQKTRNGMADGPQPESDIGPQVITPEQARALLQESERAEMQQFMNEYNFLVNRLGWAMRAVPKLSSDGRITAVLDIRRVKQ
jgi:hypothetical protein